MWTDHLRAAGLLSGGVSVLSLYTWLCIITNGMLFIATFALIVLVAVYLLVLDSVRDYRVEKEHRRWLEGVKSGTR